MITTTVMRRVLAKLEAETLQSGFNQERRAARLQALRLLRGNDGLMADLSASLNDETRGVGS